LIGTIDGQINQLIGNLNGMLSQTPGNEVAATFISNDLALSGFVLDSLAEELASGPATQQRADLYGALANEVLQLSELNALNDLGALSPPQGGNGGGTSGNA
jgi:hypothetical protein